jgi:GTP-binding protein Era
MIALSFDSNAGTLYWYFTDIDAGSTEGEGEGAATLLLDADGQIIGLELELNDSIAPEDLEFALGHPQVDHDPERSLLIVKLFDEAPDSVQPLDEPAILDFDADDRLQGCEIAPAAVFELAKRLDRAAPFLVDPDEAPDEAPGEVGEQPALLLPNASDAPTIKAGFVALVGKPNVGKSTLLNGMLGHKVAIVSPKPQTTRLPLRGILNRPDAQVIFVDTPGIHDPRTKLGSFMVDQARRAIPDADVICFVVDISMLPSRLDQRIAGLIRRARAPRLLVLNKVDKRHRNGPAHLEAYRALGPWDMEVAVSALRNEGLDTLVDEIVRRLPDSAPLYPQNQMTDQSVREQAAELVREQVLRLTEQEVPHSVAVEVEEWEEKERVLYMRMTIYVEKESQKIILIGAKGAMLKRIGSAARQSIEQALGRTIYLDLWVKPRTNWRDDPSSLHWLGYTSRGS